MTLAMAVSYISKVLLILACSDSESSTNLCPCIVVVKTTPLDNSIALVVKRPFSLDVLELSFSIQMA